jgi:enolase
MRIANIYARQIFDSRGHPTIEAEVTLESGAMGRAAVPSGASTGSNEALELRDDGEAYGGKGVSKAVNIVNTTIKRALVGSLADDQETIDDKLHKLDGTPNKSKLGANSILAVSLACAHAAAKEKNVPLFRHIAELADTKHFCMPIPMCNVLNGGKHASNSTDIQEFMLVPIGITDFTKALQACSETFHALGKILKEQKQPTTVGDEGGYAPHLEKNIEAIELIGKAVQAAGYEFGKDISVALDVAASELQESDGQYKLAKEAKTKQSSLELIGLYKDMLQKYPIMSIEDGLGEDDWANWTTLTSEHGHNTMIVGDDLTVTNPKFIKKAISEHAANALLVKPNQIGTLTETIQAVKMAQNAGWRTIISHRSGETEDTTIAHLAVGLHIPFIKTGSMSRSERLGKYNELLRIAETLPHRNTTCEL